MGWFWADTTPSSSSSAISAPHPLPNDTKAPPPGCPMHKAPAATPPPPPPSNNPSTACPYNPPTDNPSQSTPSYVSKLNPLNYMPTNISNKREAAQQSIHLPLDREPSTIPRGDGTGNWEYPSPQQMYNAMLRKGYTDTPADAVESMVAVHNFLNEGAWEEIRDWEHRFSGGLLRGWGISKHGEEGAQRQMILQELRRSKSEERTPEPQLLRFLGRPSDPTPKSRILGTLAQLIPSQFPDNPPFDRHDWYVQRHTPSGGTSEVRYVIDYYSGPPEPTGEPVFYLDVRPAVDGPRAAAERLLRWGGDVWWRASGGSVREEVERQRGRQGR